MTSSVWVTGVAWTTALGGGVDAVWKDLLAGVSGITEVPSPFRLRGTLAAAVDGIGLERPAGERLHEMTYATLRRALDDAGIDAGDPAVVPVLGTSYGPHLEAEEPVPLSRWADEAAWAAGCVTGPVVVSTACSAGSDAILLGLALLRSGAAEVCVCGGADVLTIGKRLGHSHLGTMSPDDLRAFDIGHNGTVLGEGAAFLVLETEERARARGTRSRGVVAGAGSSNDAAGAVAPDLSGRAVILAVERALRDAALRRQDVSLVNAHGSGTPVNDDVETVAYGQLFADVPRPPVLFATKGAFGHTLGATGAIEAIAVLLALDAELAPPVHALRDPLSALGLPVPAGQPMPVAAGAGLSVTLGFGGFNTCLVLQGTA